MLLMLLEEICCCLIGLVISVVKKNGKVMDTKTVWKMSKEDPDKKTSKRKINSVSSSSLVQFKNCRILYRGALITEDLWVRDGKICNPERIFFSEKVLADIQIDCKNLIIAPGFIDIQLNGNSSSCVFLIPNKEVNNWQSVACFTKPEAKVGG